MNAPKIDEQTRLKFMLSNAIAAREIAREHVQATTKARDLGKRLADEAQAAVKSHAEGAEAAEREHARALELWAKSGGIGQAPTLTEKEGAAKDGRAVARSVAVTSKTLTTLEQEVATASKVAEGAEAAVRAAALNILQAEAVAKAMEVEADEARLSPREQLAALDVVLAPPGKLLASRELNSLWAVPVLHRVSITPQFPPPSYHLDQLAVSGPHRARIAEAEKAYRERLAALMAGTVDQAAA